MNRSNGRLRPLVVALAALVVLLFASTAAADYEQVPERFGGTGEAKPFMDGWVEGMAVNYNGAGGVQPGTFYAATRGISGASASVVRFSPGSEGAEPQFQEAWGWGVATNAAEFQRCGPALPNEPASHVFHTCAANSGGVGGEESGNFAALLAVAVNPANGFVYVLNTPGINRRRHLIEVFTATGAPVGEGFGELGEVAKSIAEEPEKLHLLESGMTVDNTGTVYVGDQNLQSFGSQREGRIMRFEPENGTDFTNYVYSGRPSDIEIPEKEFPLTIAWAGGPRLVTARREQIHEYALEGGDAVPLCSQPVSGRLTALTANPVTGEVFYFNESKSSAFRLSACNEATGKFTQLQQLKPAPTTERVRALAVDPSTSWSVPRPSGILYVPSQTENASGYPFFGDIFAQAPVFSPLVKSESVSHTGTTSTTLQARVDPRGFSTSYSFQYLQKSTYAAQLAAAEGEGKSGPEAEDAAFAGALNAPLTPGQLESGAIRTAVASVGGLTPDTAYEFRIIASSECNGDGEPPCGAEGEAAAFSTYSVALAGLPDGRAYELVSPAQKNGGEVFPAEPLIGSCAPLECKPPGFINHVDPMQAAPDGDAVAYMGFAFSPTEGAAALNSYVARRTGGGWQTTAETPFQQLAKSAGTFAYSQDLTEGTLDESRISLHETSDPAALTPLVPAPLYRPEDGLNVEYGGYSPDFASQFFSANNGFALKPGTAFAPEPPDPGSAGRDLYEWREGQLSLVNVLPNETIAAGAAFASGSPDAHGVSLDGSRVFWRVGNAVYVRENGHDTREVTHPGGFVAASESGDEVLLSDGCLYSLTTEACTDLTEGKGGFQGISGANGTFTRIYFVDTAKLSASGANEQGQEAEAGKPNLYLYESGSATRFIATLGALDGGGSGSSRVDWNLGVAAERTAEASPSGRYLAFLSQELLTGHGNVGPCALITNSEFKLEVAPGPCTEVFLYDSVTGRLSCPSCNPTGEAPLGNSTLRRIYGTKKYFPQPRYLTDEGRLLFDSSDRLSPRDGNGNVEDVYEYEPGGVGNCARAAGCVLLISPGSGTVDSNFLAMDESGANVFFTTREPLVQKDEDELIDLYDAREGGGFPADTETQRGECQGEACQPAAQAPNDATPASSSFQGAGNVKEATKPKKHKHKKKKHKHKKKHGRTAKHDRGGDK